MRACPSWLASCSRPKLKNMRSCRRKSPKSTPSSWPGTRPMNAADASPISPASVRSAAPASPSADENSGTRDVSIGAAVRGLDRLDAEGSFNGRQAHGLAQGVITRAGDKALRSVLVVGATAVIQHVRRGGRGSPWIVGLLKRKPPKLAAVALANKMARIACKLMVTGNSYAAKSAAAALIGAA